MTDAQIAIDLTPLDAAWQRGVTHLDAATAAARGDVLRRAADARAEAAAWSAAHAKALAEAEAADAAAIRAAADAARAALLRQERVLGGEVHGHAAEVAGGLADLQPRFQAGVRRILDVAADRVAARLPGRPDQAEAVLERLEATVAVIAAHLGERAWRLRRSVPAARDTAVGQVQAAASAALEALHGPTAALRAACAEHVAQERARASDALAAWHGRMEGRTAELLATLDAIATSHRADMDDVAAGARDVAAWTVAETTKALHAARHALLAAAALPPEGGEGPLGAQSPEEAVAAAEALLRAQAEAATRSELERLGAARARLDALAAEGEVALRDALAHALPELVEPLPEATSPPRAAPTLDSTPAARRIQDAAQAATWQLDAIAERAAVWLGLALDRVSEVALGAVDEPLRDVVARKGGARAAAFAEAWEEAAAEHFGAALDPLGEPDTD